MAAPWGGSVKAMKLIASGNIYLFLFIPFVYTIYLYHLFIQFVNTIYLYHLFPLTWYTDALYVQLEAN